MRARAKWTGAATVIAAGAVLAGCSPATVYYRQLVQPPHAMAGRPAQDVEVLVVTPPAAPHVDVGLLQVTTGDDVRTSAEMVARLRMAAAELGCDALLITSIENQAPGRNGRPSMQGSCVVYTSPRPRTFGRS